MGLSRVACDFIATEDTLNGDNRGRLGYDPSRYTAVGLGVGLERLAMLRYGIHDIRRIEAERL